MARGEDEPASDLDIYLIFGRNDVVDQMRRDFNVLVKDIADELSFHIDVAAASFKELLRMSTEQSPFWESLVHDALVILGKGPEELLEEAKDCRYGDSCESPQESAWFRHEDAVAAEESRLEEARTGPPHYLDMD